MGYGQYSDNGMVRGDLEANNRPRGRTKEVFGSHDQTAHVWANQWETINYGRSSDGRMFFRDGTIYSYGSHFPIASFRRNKAGREFLLFTTGSYSVSTGKHISIVSRAIGYTRPNLFHVSKEVLQAYTRELADKARADYEHRIHAALERAPRRRGDNVERELQAATELAAEANRFAELIGARWRINLPEPGPELLAYAKGEGERKKAREKRDAAKKKAEQKRRAREWLDAWDGHPEVPEQYQAYMDSGEKARLADSVARTIAEWRAGLKTSYQLPRGLLRDTRNAMLRLSEDGKTIETSAGAEFPAEHGVKVWPLLKRLKQRGETWQRNGHSIHLGHFQIDSVAADGTVTAGCHTVAYAEYEAIAKQLGLE